MSKLEGFEPTEVFYFFEEISKIPRASGNEKGISDYLMAFAKEKGLLALQDEMLNVLIKKPASAGYENSKPIIIQGHMDMVCEKNSDVKHDFDKEPIELIVDGDFIKANGTTLGADNGIAIAFALALLADTSVEHPPIEAVFTVNEEIGLEGAAFFDTKALDAKRMINIDSEEEGKLWVSCAGGARATIHLKTEYEKISLDKEFFAIKLRGLKGGHSGSDINRQRANANKLMGRVLSKLYQDFNINISSISGGSKDNAIPREADAVVCLKEGKQSALEGILSELSKIFNKEFQNCDNTIVLEAEKVSFLETAFTADLTLRIIELLVLIPNGIQTMSFDIDGLVESSTNVGVVETTDKEILFTSALRSSLSTRKEIIKEQLSYLAKCLGGEISVKGEYPAWEYNKDSELRKVFCEIYKQKYGEELKIEAIHAGLECGWFDKKIENSDIISIGPTMFDVHTPDERLSISSTKKTWEFLKEVLKGLR